ncbi:serine hydrolase domain-containing protein [Francisella sp. XLW-1]|uniref:serine hydrolase domain-containing protein n=1 Tax=Francisella sp. XLW-1 TaxID=2610887 RepID=UPI00123D0590|nr:serine hydrolase domain-containing protein [Francisella sp. XLW-1]
MTSKNLFQVGSITKTFTAKLVTDAIHRKQLSLNETVGEILPQYKKWKKITIAQLLNQTSGIADYTESKNWWERLAKNPNKEWSLEELLAIAQKNPDNFRPGHGWAYSNSNYVLLGLILEKVTGQKLQLLFSALIDQYDLEQTYFLTHRYPKSIMNGMVQGYYENKENMTSINGSWLQSAGALVSTPENIVKWIKINLETNSLLHNNSNWSTTKDGDTPKNMTKTAYSAGFFRMNTPYGIVFFTPGLTPGYTSMMFYAPCLNAYFAYSVNKAPPQGLHKFMIQNLMKVFKEDKVYQQELQQYHLIPDYCQNVRPSKYFTFPKIG